LRRPSGRLSGDEGRSALLQWSSCSQTAFPYGRGGCCSGYISKLTYILLICTSANALKFICKNPVISRAPHAIRPKSNGNGFGPVVRQTRHVSNTTEYGGAAQWPTAR
jgi:hypothetical protein